MSKFSFPINCEGRDNRAEIRSLIEPQRVIVLATKLHCTVPTTKRTFLVYPCPPPNPAGHDEVGELGLNPRITF